METSIMNRVISILDSEKNPWRNDKELLIKELRVIPEQQQLIVTGSDYSNAQKEKYKELISLFENEGHFVCIRRKKYKW